MIGWDAVEKRTSCVEVLTIENEKGEVVYLN